MSSTEPHILLVEGKGALADSLVHYLTKEWHDITITHTGSAAIHHVSDRHPHVVIFDASTMRSNGVRSCQRLMKGNPDLCLIHVRSEGDKKDPAAKAHTYLERPFTARKLLNRVKQLLPPDDDEKQIVRLGDLTLYKGKGAVVVKGKGEFPLTPKLQHLLNVFMENPQEIVTRSQLMEEVWETTYVGDTRTLDVHIRWIRQIIEEVPNKPKLLTTVRGMGYTLQIDPPTKSAAAGPPPSSNGHH